jgi:hypothetical protein
MMMMIMMTATTYFVSSEQCHFELSPICFYCWTTILSQHSSIGITATLQLEHPDIGVRFPAATRDYSLLQSIQTQTRLNSLRVKMTMHLHLVGGEVRNAWCCNSTPHASSCLVLNYAEGQIIAGLLLYRRNFELGDGELFYLYVWATFTFHKGAV